MSTIEITRTQQPAISGTNRYPFAWAVKNAGYDLTSAEAVVLNQADHQRGFRRGSSVQLDTNNAVVSLVHRGILHRNKTTGRFTLAIDLKPNRAADVPDSKSAVLLGLVRVERNSAPSPKGLPREKATREAAHTT